ncbi:MAG: DUF2628 domain-containing protein [Polyangiaceae bacterium]
MSIRKADAKIKNEAEFRAVVGENADYYLARWKDSRRSGLNLAAFCMAGLWLPYRKMHREAAALFTLFLLESIASDLVRATGILRPETPRRLQIVIIFAVAWVCGAFGNAWYRSHVKRVIDAAKLDEPDETKRLSLLTARGGTSVRAAFLWMLGSVIVTGILSAVLQRTLGVAE